MSVWSRPSFYLLILLLPVAGAILLSIEGSRMRPLFTPDVRESLLPVRVASVTEAERLFERLAYPWPLPAGAQVPRIAIDPLPADYHPEMATPRKKAFFFRTLLPLVLAENRELRAQRRQVLRLRELGLPFQEGVAARAWLDGLLARYRISLDGGLAQAVERLLHHLDEIPPALALAQAANESAWGTSRFARMANNLFGQWTWEEEHGIVPAGRPEGETYLVRKFSSLRASVRDYLYNLNVGHAYEELRRLRAEMRAAGGPLDPLVLAAGLHRYSERGADYVAEIRSIIRGNRLEQLNGVELMPPESVPQLALVLRRAVPAAGSTGG